jgi:hypothetical protein
VGLLVRDPRLHRDSKSLHSDDDDDDDDDDDNDDDELLWGRQKIREAIPLDPLTLICLQPWGISCATSSGSGISLHGIHVTPCAAFQCTGELR